MGSFLELTVKTTTFFISRVLVLLILVSALFLFPKFSFAQKALRLRHDESGIFALGLRTGIVLSNNQGWNIGQGLGAQARIQATRHINTEWYFEFFHGGFTDYAVRTDGHIGMEFLFYPQHRPQRVAPFLAVGPNADYIRLRDRIDKENFSSRWAIAIQSGIGMHINITKRSDFTISTQYMLDFGNSISLVSDESAVVTIPKNGGSLDGHFIFNVSMNYKMADLWKRLKF
ncbi:MAG: hypothetical protein ACHQD9_00905 [Chitinophagales bacterium]